MQSANQLSFDDLPNEQKRSVFWGFVWRGLVITICATIGGAIAGGIVGFILAIADAAVGLNTAAIATPLGALAGLAMGMVAWWYYLRWLFRAKLAGYQLRLIRASGDAA